jgi:hypothetical protein
LNTGYLRNSDPSSLILVKRILREFISGLSSFGLADHFGELSVRFIRIICSRSKSEQSAEASEPRCPFNRPLLAVILPMSSLLFGTIFFALMLRWEETNDVPIQRFLPVLMFCSILLVYGSYGLTAAANCIF